MKESLALEGLKLLLANAETDKVLEHLIDFSNFRRNDYKIDGQTKKEIFLISSRFNNVQSKQRLGVLSESETNLELNKINIALIQIIEKLEKRVSKLEAKSENSVRINWILGSIILALIVAISYLYFKSALLGTVSDSNTSPPVVFNEGSPNENIEEINKNQLSAKESDKKDTKTSINERTKKIKPTIPNEQKKEDQLIEAKNTAPEIKTEKNESSIKYYEKGAESGDGFSLYSLGLKYYKGEGVVKDQKKAFEFFKKAAGQKHEDAYKWVGHYYDEGLTVTQDFSKAIFYYEKGIESGDGFSLYSLGLKYHKGEGVTKDPKKAFEFFKKAADQKHEDAYKWVGHYYDEGLTVTQDFSKAISYYEKGVKSGDGFSLYSLGLKYHKGEGVVKDQKKAFEFFKKAADQKHKGAYKWVGHYYDEGLTVTQDFSKAISYYEKGVKSGDGFSLYNLGLKYHKGEGVAKDPKKAFEFFKKAADQKHKDAYKWVAYYIDNGLNK